MKRQFTMVLILGGLLASVAVWTAACAPTAAPTPTATKPPATAPTQVVASPAPKPPTAVPATPTVAVPAATPAPSKAGAVKIGELGLYADAPFYIAFEKGYFREQGIEVEFQRFRSAVDMVAPLSTGELQVGGGAISVGLFNAAARGVGIKAIANRSRQEIPFDAAAWMARADLKGQVKGFADFKGRTVNVLSEGHIAYYILGISLEKYGVSLKDVKLEHLGPPETAGAFEKKSIDISLVVEPNIVVLGERGIAFTVMEMTKESGPLDIASVMYSEKWAKENPDMAKKFAVAYLKGHRDYITAMQNGPNRKEVINIGIKYTALKDPAAYEKMIWGAIPPDGYVDKESLKKTQQWFIQNGYQQAKADVDTLVDNSYLDYANQVLGKPKS